MRFSAAAAALAGLPALAVADAPDYQAQFQAQFQQYLGQAQPYIEKVQSFIPNPNKHDPIGAAEAKAGAMKMDVLTIGNWNETLYEPVVAGAAAPVEWYVLITGGNKTCFGMYRRVGADCTKGTNSSRLLRQDRKGLQRDGGQVRARA